jgi:hypothetical protein
MTDNTCADIGCDCDFDNMIEVPRNPFDALDPDLLFALESYVFGVNPEVGYDRSQGLGHLLFAWSDLRDGDEPRHDVEALERALPEGLLSMLKAQVQQQPEEPWIVRRLTIEDILSDWETQFVDSEKLLGHLLISHGDADQRGYSLEELSRRHRELHAIPTTRAHYGILEPGWSP